jgi:DNA-binding MarR family transcriptional regulator
MMPDFVLREQARKRPDGAWRILLTWTTIAVNSIIAAGYSGPARGPWVMGRTRRINGTKALRRTAQLRRSKPAIDLGVLNERLGYFARRLQVAIFQDFIARLAGIDISPAQFSVLAVIGANEGLSQSELAATLGIERARLVRLLHRLEQRSLTQRLPSSADGRRHALRLTREGQRILARAKALSDQHEAALMKRLGAERHKLLLETLREI